MRAQDQEPASTCRSQPRQAPTRATGPAPIPPHPAVPLPPQAILHLQRTIGNASVARLIRTERHQPHSRADDLGHGQPVQRSTVPGVLRSPGRPLDTPLREEMEARLGADFSDVRLHDDAAAKASAAELGARAYTSGNHVVIGDSGADQHTLAHELTHVVQQRQGPVAGTETADGLRISDPSDRFERAAEANAARALATPPPQSGHTDHPERPGEHRADNVVQRAPREGLRQLDHRPAPAAPQGKMLDELLTELKIHGDAYGRWIDDYHDSFDEIRRVLPGFQATSDEERTAYLELSTAYTMATTGVSDRKNSVQAIIDYLLDGGTAAPGLGGFGTLRVNDAELEGRPSFARDLQKALPLRPTQHRRHITAWHNIRGLLNRAYATEGDALITYLTRKLGAGVHEGMSNEADGFLARMPPAQLGNENRIPRDHAQVLMKAAYLMNSSAENLWAGGGAENSEINTVSIALQNGCREIVSTPTPEVLTAWRNRLSNSTASTPKARDAVDAVVKAIDRALQLMTNAPANRKIIAEQLKDDVTKHMIRNLEVDEPDAANQRTTTTQAVGVANKTFDLLFLSTTDQVTLAEATAAIDFLWTPRRPQHSA
ncbi:DUF4157 domain-containing protein [Saccharopolyspora aridisoli]|uniref:DUF4157 domain-containing protein n=2 Tax=Saccharopolyspora aridisoli TaxID=2530385 RepID=A0A4R4UQJ0_9PSEU|nr:DUF4157 domain-containing protein [Saccharopolyspora aridisoli]